MIQIEFICDKEKTARWNLGFQFWNSNAQCDFIVFINNQHLYRLPMMEQAECYLPSIHTVFM
jgi:hypothetical protein